MKNRLAKLIEMLPWITMNQGASVTQIAHHFSLSEKEVLDLLQLAVLTGPGQFGGELVDIDFEDADSIYVSDAKGLTRPITFSAAQSLQIISGLHYLAQIPGVIDNRVLASLQMKFMKALGVDQTPIEVLQSQEVANVMRAIGQAISENRVIRIEYVAANQGKIAKRLIDPKKIFVDNNVNYVSAWCHAALAIRLFRVDRIKSYELTNLSQKEHVSETKNSLDGSNSITVEISATKEAYLELDPEFVLESKLISDTEYSVTYAVHNLNWMAREILASAGQLRAIAPTELVELVAEKKAKWRQLNHID